MMKQITNQCPVGTPVEFPKTSYQKNHSPYEKILLLGHSQSPRGGQKWYDKLVMATLWYLLAAKRK